MEKQIQRLDGSQRLSIRAKFAFWRQQLAAVASAPDYDLQLALFLVAVGMEVHWVIMRGP